MKRKRIPRPALPPPGLRPTLRRDQLRDLSIAHLQALDAIVNGDANIETLWAMARAVLAWSHAADRLHIGEAEMIEQMHTLLALIERYQRTGRVGFSGAEYQSAKEGVAVMDDLAERCDIPTALAACAWAERRLADIQTRCRAAA